MKHEWRADPLVWGHGPERVLPAVAFSISNTVLGSAAKDSNRCRPRGALDRALVEPYRRRRSPRP
jgi:hypothetical protein